MFECRCLNDLFGNQTSAPIFEFRLATDGRRGKSFLGCRGADELVHLYAPAKPFSYFFQICVSENV